MDNYDTMGAEELEKLQKAAQAKLQIIAEARQLKERSAHILNRFQAAFQDLARVKWRVLNYQENNNYGSGKVDRRRVEIAVGSPNSPVVTVLLKLLEEAMDTYGRGKPFGLVPAKDFWEEWTSKVAEMTVELTTRYRQRFVDPYPVDTVENIRAFKVMEQIEEAAEPVVGDDIDY